MSRRGWFFLLLFLLPVLGAAVALLFWYLLQRYGRLTPAEPGIIIPIPAEEDEERQPVGEVQPAQPDDLRRIEGIGPKISAVLQEAGIKTYTQLAVTGVSQIKNILNEAGVRAAPDTWPEQARLAATGDWEELSALQAELKGGRRA